MEAVQTKLAIGNTVIGTYTAYTPTLTNVTVGDGVVTGSYCLVNGFVHYYGSFTMGSTSAVTGSPSVLLPINLNSDMDVRANFGVAQYFDNSTSTTYIGQTRRNTASYLILTVSLTNSTYEKSSNMSATAPFTWAVDDVMTWNLYYRAA
jgi:UDP-3-O-[3-hydroxymyristoyl] glucosamine N-acyltransferase